MVDQEKTVLAISLGTFEYITEHIEKQKQDSNQQDSKQQEKNIITINDHKYNIQMTFNGIKLIKYELSTTDQSNKKPKATTKTVHFIDINESITNIIQILEEFKKSTNINRISFDCIIVKNLKTDEISFYDKRNNLITQNKTDNNLLNNHITEFEKEINNLYDTKVIITKMNNYLKYRKINDSININILKKKNELYNILTKLFTEYLNNIYIGDVFIKKIHAINDNISTISNVKNVCKNLNKYKLNDFTDEIDDITDPDNTFNYLESIKHFQTYMEGIYNAVNEYNRLTKNEINELSVLIDNKLEEKVNNAIITYVKINSTNQYGVTRPHRFRFYLNKNKNKKNMIVQYNDSPDKINETNNTLESPVKIFKDKPKYLLGNFTDIFTLKDTNADVVNKMSNIVSQTLISDPPPIFIVGYGASGAGKTSNLIYFRNGDDSQDGILPLLCKKIIDEHIDNEFEKIVLNVKEYSVYEVDGVDGTQQNSFDSNQYEFHMNTKDQIVITNTRDVKIHHSYNFDFKLDELDKDKLINDYSITRKEDGSFEFIEDTELGKVIVFLVDVDRIVKATTNNDQSSRSHVLVFVEIYFKDKIVKLIVGDFAGIENKFLCDSENTINKMGELVNTKKKKETDENKKKYYIGQSIYNKNIDNYDTIRGGVKSNPLINKEYTGDEGNVFPDDDDTLINLENTINNNIAIPILNQFFELYIKPYSIDRNVSNRNKPYAEYMKFTEKDFNKTIKEKIETINEDIESKIKSFKQTLSTGNQFDDKPYKEKIKSLKEEIEKLKPTSKAELETLIEKQMKELQNKITYVNRINSLFHTAASSHFKENYDKKAFNTFSGGIQELALMQYLKADNTFKRVQNDFTNRDLEPKFEHYINPDDQFKKNVQKQNEDYMNLMRFNTKIDVDTVPKVVTKIKNTDTGLGLDPKLINSIDKLDKSQLKIGDNIEIKLNEEYTIKFDIFIKKGCIVLYALKQISVKNNDIIDKINQYNETIDNINSLNNITKVNAEIDETLKKKKLELSNNEIELENAEQKFNESKKNNESTANNLENTLIEYILNSDINTKFYTTISGKNFDYIMSNNYFILYYCVKKLDEQYIALFKAYIIKQYFLYKACTNRLAEGEWINKELRELRKAIEIVVKSKNFNVFYNYNDSCFNNNNYIPDNLSKSANIDAAKNNTFINSILEHYKRIDDTIDFNYILSRMIICIYCVFNYGYKETFEPPTPYLNIDDLNKIKVKDIVVTNIVTILEKIQKSLSLLKITQFSNSIIILNDKSIKTALRVIKYNTSLNEMVLNDFLTDICSTIKTKTYTSNDHPFLFNIIVCIRNHINVLNATSAMGSLEFIDQVAKLNTVNYLCTTEDISKEYILLEDME